MEFAGPEKYQFARVVNIQTVALMAIVRRYTSDCNHGAEENSETGQGAGVLVGVGFLLKKNVRRTERQEMLA